jgi:ATP-dependent helicase HrpA
MSRNLAQLRAELGGAAGERFAAVAKTQAAGERYTDWSFGELAEVMEIRRGAQTLIGYPALTDADDAVTLEVLDSAERAREQHRAGLRRLFTLQLKEQAKFIEKNLPGLQALALAFIPFGDANELRSQLLAAAFDRTCLAEPWPRGAKEFARRRDEARARVTLIAQELARLAGTILGEHQALQKKLQQAAKAFPEACRDIREGLARLLPKRFIAETPFDRLQHFPRYLKAASLRLDKLRTDSARDARNQAEISPLLVQWQRELAKRQKSGERDPRLDQFGWMLEELRVQLFAQELKTPVPVSAKRLQKMWVAMQR